MISCNPRCPYSRVLQLQGLIFLYLFTYPVDCFMASPLDVTMGLLQEGREIKDYDISKDIGNYLGFSDDQAKVAIPKISEAFNKYDTFGNMEDLEWNNRIGLYFLMSEAIRWNYDDNIKFRQKTNSILECRHKMVEECHDTYKTEFTPVQEEKCSDRYEKDCIIVFNKQPTRETFKRCHKPMVKTCDDPLNGDANSTCHILLETSCSTKYRANESDIGNKLSETKLVST